jgi:hypothetical protein
MAGPTPLEAAHEFSRAVRESCDALVVLATARLSGDVGWMTEAKARCTSCDLSLQRAVLAFQKAIGWFEHEPADPSCPPRA